MVLNTLSGRFLLLTIAFVMLAEVFIFVPSVARFREDYLLSRLERAQIAALDGQRIHGTIDRLIVTENSVLAVDFKTNAVVPENPGDCPLGLVPQMAAYAHALTQIFPGREVQTALLWTRNAQLMQLPETALTHSIETICPS